MTLDNAKDGKRFRKTSILCMKVINIMIYVTVAYWVCYIIALLLVIFNWYKWY